MVCWLAGVERSRAALAGASLAECKALVYRALKHTGILLYWWTTGFTCTVAPVLSAGRSAFWALL